MTDYKEDQKNEIGALESIYPSELTVLLEEPFHVFTIDLSTENFSNDPVHIVSVCLKFTYTPGYPDEEPLIEIENCENLEEDDSKELLKFLQNEAQENLGMVMVFTLVSAALEWLNQRGEENVKKKQEEEEKRKRQEEEEEQKRFEGTRVTIETFLSWKAKFDLERASLSKQQKAKEDATKKFTGRELFEKDRSLILSDLEFGQDGDDVKVDESLFQELDDLDLDEDLDDDFESY
ncbi:RWD domain-containing protein 1-like [Limulus polyphemus]|uniref:RWD domain-containing protein 1-like n=1 Tax=Limulus polyphemus TaxID=6850 RepID=A0ABM1BK27_LIMPO|nr:RWD domain-containing protein 1-like [Limulus polyphemus]